MAADRPVRWAPTWRRGSTFACWVDPTWWSTTWSHRSSDGSCCSPCGWRSPSVCRSRSAGSSTTSGRTERAPRARRGSALTRLRNVLGHDAIVRARTGYALAPEVGSTAERFEQLLRRGRDRSLEIRARVRILDEASGRMARSGVRRHRTAWTWVDAAAVRLDELREQAVDLRFELRLVDDEPASLVSELRTALDRLPDPRTARRDAGAGAVSGGTAVRGARRHRRACASRSATGSGWRVSTGLVGARDADPASGSRSAPHGHVAGRSFGRARRARGCARPRR